jgi:hypothetical protein
MIPGSGLWISPSAEISRAQNGGSAGVGHGATGLASHGWTDEQAHLFAQRCRTVGFTDIAIDSHRSGRRTVLSVLARAA